MTSLLYYLLQVSIYAGFAHVIYFFTWRNSTLFKHSRAYLLTGMILPCILPFIHLPMTENNVLAHYDVSFPLAVTTPPHQLLHTHYAVQQHTTFSWAGLLAGMYIAGIAFLTLLYLRSYILINIKLRKGSVTKYRGYTVITNTAIGPGTLGKRIFFPGDKINEMIFEHELVHIRSAHRIDAWLMQLMHIAFWISPAHWLLGRELKMVHEFEADGVANRNADPEAYTSLLIAHQLNISPSLLVTHSFFQHPLKRRIMMLEKIKTAKAGGLVFASVLVTTIFTSIALLAQTESADKTEITTSGDQAKNTKNNNPVTWNDHPKLGEVKMFTDGTMAYIGVEKMPLFPGDIGTWLNNNLQPTATQGGDGHAIISFVVDGSGKILRPTLLQSSGNDALDAEALRLVGNMPDWYPGILNSNMVPVYCMLPISFKNGRINSWGC